MRNVRNRSLWVRLVLTGMLMLGILVPVQAEDAGLSGGFCFTGINDVQMLSELVPYSGSTSIRVKAWQDDTVYLKAMIQADQNMHVSLSAEPMTALKSGQELQVQASFLKPVSFGIGMGTDPSIPHEIVYDRISSETEADLIAGQPAYIWISVHTNADSRGRYDGVIRVMGEQELVLKIETVVLPLQMDSEAYSANLWQYPFSSLQYYAGLQNEAPFSEAHQEALRKELSFYREIGGRDITCTITEEPWAHQTYFYCPSLVTWNVDGSGNLWFDYQKLDAWIELCESCGLSGKIDCFSILPFDEDITVFDDMGNPMRMVLNPGDETWRYYWENFLWSFFSHMKETGRLSRVRMMVDERGIPWFQHAIDLVRSIDGGDQVQFGAAVNVIPRDTALYDQIAYLSISIASLPENDGQLEAFLAHRRELGLETTMYNCSTNYPNAFAGSDPAESVWSMQYLYNRGLDGYLRWAYDAWPENPLECADNPHFEAGDTFLIYPDQKDSQGYEPSSSVRLCMIHQGLNDIRKAERLSSLLEGAGADSMNEALSAASVRYGGTYNAYGRMTHISEENRRSIAQQTLLFESITEKAARNAAMRMQGLTVMPDQ